MGCGVAALAGFSCDWIANVILAIYALFAAMVLFFIYKLGNPSHLFRNEIIAVGIFVSPFVWGQLSGARELAIIRAQLQEFQTVCYEKAHEKIDRTTRDLKTLVLSPSSKIRFAPDWELFFGRTRPDKWAGTFIITSPDSSSGQGVYELRYSHVPIELEIMGRPTVFHSVHQQIFDRGTNELIAERVNVLFGSGYYCLGTQGLSGWIGGNDDFADRVLGYRYATSGEARKNRRGYEQHLKATQIGEEEADVELKPHTEMTNYGSRTSIEGVYYYLEQSLQKRPPIEGQNPVLAKYLENPPYSFVSVIAYNDGYLAIALPHGGLRNRPPLDTLFVFLSKDATEIRRIYAQIPPGIHWINGWGLNPSEVVVGEKTVSFYLYGKKKRAEKGSDQTNEGRYAKRYAYRIQIPVKP